MVKKILVDTTGTPIVFADNVAYQGRGGARTHQINLVSLASGTAQQSDKADMDTGGVSNRFPKAFIVTARVDMLNAPNVGDYVSIYWAASLSSDEPTGNPGGVIGSDGAYTGTAGSTLEESLKDLQLLGKLFLTPDGATVQQQQTFRASLPTQFGTVVVVNNSVRDFVGNGNDLSVTFTPREYEVQ